MSAVSKMHGTAVCALSDFNERQNEKKGRAAYVAAAATAAAAGIETKGPSAAGAGATGGAWRVEDGGGRKAQKKGPLLPKGGKGKG